MVLSVLKGFSIKDCISSNHNEPAMLKLSRLCDDPNIYTGWITIKSTMEKL